MLPTRPLLVDESLRLLRPARFPGFLLTPTLSRDRDVVGEDLAWAAFDRTGWDEHLSVPPSLLLCRYHDAASRQQVAWVVRGVCDRAVPVPWYVGLETSGRLPAPPWEVFVVINATNGIRIVDRISHLSRALKGRGPRVGRTHQS